MAEPAERQGDSRSRRRRGRSCERQRCEANNAAAAATVDRRSIENDTQKAEGGRALPGLTAHVEYTRSTLTQAQTDTVHVHAGIDAHNTGSTRTTTRNT